MVSPSDSAARSADAGDNDFIANSAIPRCNTVKGSEETKRLKGADEKLSSTTEKHSVEDDDAVWETDKFKEFHRLMNKYDYFDTNSRIPLEEEVFKLLDSRFKEKTTPEKPVWIRMPSWCLFLFAITATLRNLPKMLLNFITRKRVNN